MMNEQILCAEVAIADGHLCTRRNRNESHCAQHAVPPFLIRLAAEDQLRRLGVVQHVDARGDDECACLQQSQSPWQGERACLNDALCPNPVCLAETILSKDGGNHLDENGHQFITNLKKLGPRGVRLPVAVAAAQSLQLGLTPRGDGGHFSRKQAQPCGPFRCAATVALIQQQNNGEHVLSPFPLLDDGYDRRERALTAGFRAQQAT
mmetsp:Transcript_27179/g.59701  ORF Transcript_27179/g.59701 Transcript_27179/m.59701 type:complete len:207 (-) Transcript_27179:382-1002(-)